MESNKNDDVTCEMKSKPQSYVIFDTETTGLPGPYGNPKITELCLLGIHRDDMFEDGVAVPRIVNKMQLCLNPQKQVSPGSSMLTGLFNDALDRQQPFNSEIVEVIRGFLQTQAQPACLIAHNGDKFDFPLLAAQLRKVNQTLPDEILCADSLLAFREIDPPTDRPRSPIKVRSQTWEITEVTPAKRQNSDEQLHVPKKPKKDFDKTHSLFENIRRERAARQLYKDEANASVTEDETVLDKAVSLSENIHSRSGTQSIDVKLTGSDPENTQALISSQEDANKDENESQSILGGFQPSVKTEATVVHDELPHKKASSELNSQGSLPDAEFLEAVQHMEKQDDKDFSVVYYRGQEVKVSDNDGKPSNTARDSNHNCSVVVHNQNGAASSNISSIKHVMPKSVQRKSYRLIDIYTRCFGHPPSVAHTAEDDCIALLKIVKKSTPQFLDWVDEHCVLFNTIPPMY